MDILEKINQQVQSHPIILYMKGTPQFPQCGFSSQVVQILGSCGVEFAHVNVLADPEIRENVKRYANWPTFPQMYLNGELVGGCDIIVELQQKGELKPMLEQAIVEFNAKPKAE